MDDGSLATEGGQTVPALAWSHALFLDKTTVLYGPTRSGKTMIIKAMMDTLRQHIDQILVVSPTQPANRSYDGYVPEPLIHYRLWLPGEKAGRGDDRRGGMRFLEAILKRQEMMAAIYTRASNLTTLSALYKRLPAREQRDGSEYVAALQRRRDRALQRLRSRGPVGDREREVQERFARVLALVYKKFIAARRAELLAAGDLSDDERWCLSYLQFNPRLLLIFDDCAADLKPYFAKDVFRQIFYQGRWSFLTTIISCQDDTDLPANLRKNAFVSFFTTDVVCAANFERGSNKYPKSEQLTAREAASAIYTAPNRKLAYIRDDPRRQKFYHYTAPVVSPVMFGSPALLELCGAVRSDGTTMDRENPYYARFQIGS